VSRGSTERDGSDGDGVVGVAGNVPAGAAAALGEEGVATGDVLFGMDLVEFESGVVGFVGYGEKANAVNRAGSSTEFREMKASLVPGEVHKIEKKNCTENKGEQTKPWGMGSDGNSR
jgi:hypothetical protein